jgi:HD-GYP domain-containing protein (c-di-GMP phosphodiesterase class II)
VFNVLEDLVTTVDNKDHCTRRHSDDVCERAVALAAAMGLSHETQRVLRIAGLLHDVDKIGVPDSVLRNPGSLYENEFEAAATHYERHDGKGYPDGLSGDDIPLLGRILAVADAYSAMTSDRPYRKALSVDDAIAKLRRVAGKQLDPQLVQQFIQVVEEEGSHRGDARRGEAGWARARTFRRGRPRVRLNELPEV